MDKVEERVLKCAEIEDRKQSKLEELKRLASEVYDTFEDVITGNSGDGDDRGIMAVIALCVDLGCEIAEAAERERLHLEWKPDAKDHETNKRPSRK